MALDVAALTQAIEDVRNIDTENGPITNEQLAAALATAIDDFIKSGDIIISTGSSAGTYKVT